MKHTSSRTAQLTLGAVLLALFIILHMIVPGGNKAVQSLLMVVTILPVAIYALCCGIKASLIVLLAGAALSALLLQPVVLLSYAVPALVIGLIAGMCYGKRKRILTIGILTVLHLLQNIFEILLYQLMMDINFLENYDKVISMILQAIPEILATPMFMTFAEDLLVCAIPGILLIGAVAKGILSFVLIKFLMKVLAPRMGISEPVQNTEPTQFNGKLLSIVYFVIICVCTVLPALTFLSVIPYHFVFAAIAAFGVLCAIAYTYYFYLKRIRSQEDHQKRLIGSFLLVALIPVNIFTMPIYELYQLKKD